MPQALITVGGVAGSNTNSTINTLVQLNNTNIGGEATFLWTIVAQPTGTVDSLSSAVIVNPTFTPKKEGTYLIRLVVNAGASQLTNQIVVAVRHLKSQIRIPAAGETTEASTATGWTTAPAMDTILALIDSLRADPGLFVAVAGVAGLAAGDVVKVSAVATIKTGLPGQELLPSVVKAPANVAANMDQPLAVVVQEVAGGAIALNSLLLLRRNGRIASLVGVPVAGDPVYVSDTATLSLAAGTTSRKVGVVIAVAATYTAFFDGAYSNTSAASSAPANAAFLTNGAVAGLSAEVNILALLANLVFQAGGNGIVPLVAKWFSAGQTADMFQAQNNVGTVVYSVDANGNVVLPSGGGSTLLKTGAALTIGTASAFSLVFRANAVDCWAVLSTGVLAAQGGNRAIQNVLDPVTAQDASTKNYVDTGAQASVLTFGNSATSSVAATTDFLDPWWYRGATQTAQELCIVVPSAGKIAKLRIRAVAGPITDSIVFTVRKNGVDTISTATLAAAGTTTTDLVNTFTVAAGDRISLKGVSGAALTVGATFVQVSMEYTRA